VRASVVFAALAVASAARAQQPAIGRLRALAMRDDAAPLAAAVRERPDDGRELLRRLFSDVAASRGATADSTLVLARRVADAFAVGWSDSFPIAQVTWFAAMTPGHRAAKVAADSVRRAGNVALGHSGVRSALALWREALRRASALNDSAGEAAALGNIGNGYYHLAAYDSAVRFLERARALAEAVHDQRTALNALGLLGNVAKDRGELRRAQTLYSRTLELRARIGDVRGIAADHNNLGLIAFQLGDADEARGHYRDALALARRHALNEPAAAALVNLGNVAGLDADYGEAARRYDEALVLYRSLGDDGDVALVLHDLGLMELRRGSYRKARARLGEALAIYQRLGAAADVVQARRDLASVAAATGDLPGALDELRSAERLLERMPARSDLAAAVALARGDLASQLNSYAAAEHEYVRAEALYRRTGDGAGVAEAEEGYALLLVERAQYGRALALLESAVRAQTLAGDRRPAALTCLDIGYLQLRRGEIALARHAIEQALDSLRAVGDVVGEAAALASLGDVEMAADAPLAAEADYRRGLARLEQRSVPTISWQLHAGLGQALRAVGALPNAERELYAAVADIERVAGTLGLEDRRAAYLVDKWDVYAELAAVERARGDAAAAFVVSERMRARQMLDLMARGRITAHSSADSALLEREQDVRRQVAELTRQLEREGQPAGALRGPNIGATSGVTREALARAQEQYAQILLDLREDAASTPVLRGEVVSWHDVAQRLTTGEALVEYLVSDSTTVAFVVTHDTLRTLDLGVSRHELAALVDFLRGTMVRPRAMAAKEAWRAPLRRLYSRLVAPLEDAGTLSGVHRLIIVPHAELHYLPFAALVRSDEAHRARDEFLIERYEVAYTPSASVWVRMGERAPPRGTGVLALAPRASVLAGSREEVEAIRALYGSEATVLTDAAATETAFRAAVPRYSVVHLATYGVLNKHNPLFSFVELAPTTASIDALGEADGRLEVHEVFGLALEARLLVLSACQTALGSGALSDLPAGDDWVGLVRAFLGVGVANVIATLWPVEDRSTARLMVALHSRLKAGRAESAALAEAQREALRNPATADPFYWAGFVLVGGR
jgi:CHAT domain-containing protein